MERLHGPAPEVPPEGDRLVKVRAADVEPVGRAQVGELGPVPADADAGDDPAAGQGVERRQLLGQDDGSALGHDDDARAEPDPGMPRADVGEGEDRLEDPAVFVGRVAIDQDVVGRPDGRPADPVGDLRRRLDPLRAGAGMHRRQHESVVHGADGSGEGDRLMRELRRASDGDPA